MPKLSLEKWASLVVVVAGGAGVLFLGVKYLFPALLPFLLAWGFAFLLRPLSCALAKRFHITAHHATVRLSRLREKLKAELLQEGIAV